MSALLDKMHAKLECLETAMAATFENDPRNGHMGTPHVDNSKGRQMRRIAPWAWAAAALLAIAISAAPVYLDGPGPHDEATATAASVADAQRTAKLQAAIDRACTDHTDPLNCALRVVQREQPDNWTPHNAQRAHAAATLLTTNNEQHEKEQP